MKRWLSFMIIGLCFIGVSHAQCRLVSGGINPAVGTYEFRMTQGAQGGLVPINRPNSLIKVSCPAGASVNWHTSRSQPGSDFQTKLDDILHNINARERRLMTEVVIYGSSDPTTVLHSISLNYGAQTASIVERQNNAVPFLAPGNYDIAIFASGRIVGDKNTTATLTLQDRRPFFTLSGIGTLYFAVEYIHDPELPDPEYCNVSYSLSRSPTGTINLGTMSQGELESGKETTTDIQITVRRYMSGNGCYKERNPTVRLTAKTNLDWDSHEAKLANGTSAFVYGVIPEMGIVREWVLDGMTPQPVGSFNSQNENISTMRLVWKKTADATLKQGVAGGTIYITAQFM